jgi:hypothetical protein
MEKGKQERKWDWLPAFMPGVAARLSEHRHEHGKAHVALCWQRGVVECQPGWFFAREGAISVGVPPVDDAALLALAFDIKFSSQSFVYLRTPGKP